MLIAQRKLFPYSQLNKLAHFFRCWSIKNPIVYVKLQLYALPAKWLLFLFFFIIYRYVSRQSSPNQCKYVTLADDLMLMNDIIHAMQSFKLSMTFSLVTEAHYHVTINIAKTNESMNYGGEVGQFVIRVIGPNGKISDKIALTDNSKYYEAGSKHTIVVPGDLVGKVESVELTWNYHISMFNPLTWRLLQKPKAYVDSLSIKSLEFHNEWVNSFLVIINLSKIVKIHALLKIS